MVRAATTRITTAASAKPTKAPVTCQTSARPSSRTVFTVENPTSKLACVRNRRRPLAEPTKSA